MSKILKLNSYSQYDELGDRDYMVYEVKYDDGHKEYVSRDIFRNLKALKIIKEKSVDTVAFFRSCYCCNRNSDEVVSMYNQICADFYVPFAKQKKTITKEECDLLTEVML